MTKIDGSETGYGFVNMGVSACDAYFKSVFVLLRERERKKEPERIVVVA